VVEHIRKGTLDFVLLKPADAQFLVSTARFSPWRATAIVNALVVFAIAFHRLGRPPSLGGVALALVMLVVAVAVLYALWILTVSAAFYVVRVDNLTFLFGSIFDFARWPASVFRGAVAFVFTFVIPLALMTTYPAEAMLGRLEPRKLALSLVAAVVVSWIARRVWLRSIARYTSASS
jgi:ABC-2 type transport system permease protein